MYDVIIIGAGFAGASLASLLAEKNNKVLVIEKRDHIGGQAYDYFNKDGVLVHKYGPHIFHTNKKEIFQFLSQFTKWHIYNHRVKGYVEDKYIPIPFNLNSIYKVFPEEMARKMENILIEEFDYGKKVSIWDLKKKKNKNLKILTEYIYEKIFYNYTEKQWGVAPDKLDKSVTSKVPVTISRDNRYFYDKYQAMPKNGYTNMFKKMLSHKNINLLLNTDYKEVIKIKENSIYLFNQKVKGEIFYTGPIDYFFDYKFGQLSYRTIDFRFKTFDTRYYQQNSVINYPNNYNFTRITEFKYLTKQNHNKTTIVKEYPSKCEISQNDIPYYPVPKKENRERYNKYKRLISNYENLFMVGRLAEYKYYNMTEVIEKVFKIIKNID